jgi:predicted metal-dependent hydrolase
MREFAGAVSAAASRFALSSDRRPYKTAMDGRVRQIPLEYSVRESRRAKHVHLRMSVHGGLEVVVPLDFDRSQIPALLREKEGWLRRTAEQIEAQRRRISDDPPDRLPSSMVLRAIERTWTTEPIFLPRSQVRTEERGGRLILSGPITEPSLWRPALRGWLMAKAREALPERLEGIATRHGFTIDRVTIRCQRSRWGSCSQRRAPHREMGGGQGTAARSGAISLNAQLLFLPSELVDYVVLHELCHTRILSHSPAFWNLLERHHPESERRRSELRDAWQYVPSWLAQGHRDTS